MSDKGWGRLEQLFADPHNKPEQTTWAVYQKIMSAYRAKTPTQGKQLMSEVIDSLTTSVPDALEELKSLAKTLNQRRDDILAHYRSPRHIQQTHPSSQRPAWNTYAASPWATGI
nr:transposase [Actinomyces qiguomingii]